MRKITLLFAVLLSLAGVTQVKADELTVSDGTNSNEYVPFYGNWADAYQKCEFIIPAADLSTLTGKDITALKFYSNTANQNWNGTFQVFLKEVEATTLTAFLGTTDATVVFEGDGVSVSADKEMAITFTTNYSYKGGNLLVGIYQTKVGNYKSMKFYGISQTSNTAWQGYSSSSLDAITGSAKTFIPKTTLTYEAKVEGAGFAAYDGTTKLTSPYAYNYGLATAGTEKVFTLKNPGTESVNVSVEKTGDFGATLSASSIAAGGEVTLTVTMADATGNGTITVKPEGLDDFVINVSGTIRDANKVYETLLTGSIPEDWTTSGGTWSWSTTNGASNTAWYETSNYRLITPKLTIAEGEQFFFDAQGTYDGYQGVIFEYSADGTNWTASSTTTTVNTNWQTFAVSDIPAGNYYIALHGWHVNIRNFYGGQIPNEPKMVVTQPASLDFGVITEATAKTFTIANTGLATLEGISVTSSNSSIFAVTGAPTSLAAGASAEVTITMSAANTGALSSEITVSATGMEDVKFTVTGVVMPDGLSKEEFTDGLPANWTNASWTFANGEATGKSSSAYLTTPKLVISEGDMIVIKAKRADSDATDYITIQGSNDNGATWTAYSKKISGSEGLTYPDYATLVLSDVPTTVNKIRFVGYYVVVDEVAGLTYAPVLTVTKGGEAVSTPASYDFGETAADATVTYNFANAGAGTINITNVAITGDGAAAYSTNWTESVAAPFALTITRTYDANRTEAQAAVVTVTTSEGDFVINVTGTDKAANAPELAVSTNAIDFVKVIADAVETVTVTNNGTGSMTVNIASDSEDFVVSATELTEIGAGESKTFDVTFKYGTPYGVKNGNITVTPTYDANAAQTIIVTGKAKDPNVWSEDFAAGELPTGWDAGANWTIAEGVAKGSWTSSANYLTTAPLTVSATTDELTFDYVTTGGNVSIAIQMSKDGGDWTTCAATPVIPTYMSNGTSGTATITGLEAGSYQFRFKNDDYNLDNFEGFKLNLPEHMAIISEYTIPESSSWTVTMKEGQSFDATVTVKEQRGVAEELTAKLYMGEEVIGTATGSVEAKGTKVLTITATPNVAAAEGAQMHIEVEWAGATMKTEEVTRYVAAITYLTLDETSSDAVVAGTYDNVTLKRQFAEGWNTVCLPFTVNDVEAFFGENAKAYEFSGYNDNGNLSFSKVTKLNASYPYIVYVPAAITEDIELKDITIDASAWYTRKTNSSNAAVYFRGTYAPVAAGAWTKNADTDVIYGLNGNKLQKAGAAASIKGFRAYFDVPAAAEGRLAISFDGETTGIATIKADGSLEIEGAYNLNGQRVAAPQKGLYIVNGKKVVIK